MQFRRAAECSACRADLSGDNLATRIKHIFACRAHTAQQVTVAAQQVAAAELHAAAEDAAAEEAGQLQADCIGATADSFAPGPQLSALPMQPPTLVSWAKRISKLEYVISTSGESSTVRPDKRDTSPVNYC